MNRTRIGVGAVRAPLGTAHCNSKSLYMHLTRSEQVLLEKIKSILMTEIGFSTASFLIFTFRACINKNIRE